ncbi:polysaccharide biosynthesis protein, partial [Micrococcus luteus]
MALGAATLFRFEFVMGPVHWASVLSVIVLTAVMQLVAGYLMGFYRGRYGYGTFEEVRGLTALVVGVSIVVTGVLLVVGDAWQVPRSLLLIAGPIALVLMLGLRYVHRLRREAGIGPGEDAAPTLIYGAGMLGEVLARRMQIDSE